MYAYVLIIIHQGSIENDPHFFLPLANGENLCFSIQGQPDFTFSLINDKFVQLNAQFVLPASDMSSTISNVTTFLGNLGLLLRCPTSVNGTIIKVTAQDHSILVGDEYIKVEDQPINVMILCDTSATTVADKKAQQNARGGTAWININSEFGFGMKIRFYKKHLDMMITKHNGSTSEADGLMGNSYSAIVTAYFVHYYYCIGQLMEKHIKIDPDYNMMRIGDHKPIFVVKGTF